MSDIDDELLALAGGDDDGDIEEGEASSVASSPNSLGSDAMDESDSDREDDVPANDSDVLYPLEGKYRDAKDRARIMALGEIEKEQILAERAQEVENAKWSAEVARRAARIESSGMMDRKRKADSEEPDDSQRKSSRQKVKGKVNSSLEEYKRKREQVGQQRQRQDDRRNGRRHSSSDRDDGSDLDAEGESEVEYYEQEKEPVREELPATLQHFEWVRVGRGFFSDVCFYPGFEEATTGTFARIGTGQDAQHRTLYKMAQIKGFSTGKPYVFEGKNGQKVATDQYVVAQHGSVKKEYNFSFLSNQRFTETDLDIYKQSLAEAGGKVPTESFLKKKFQDMKALKDRFWTDADITERINKQSKYRHLLARSSSDAGPKIATQSELEAQRIAELNRQNRKADSERVRQALIEERRQQQSHRKAAEREAARKKAQEEAAQRKVEEEAKKASLAVDDLFDGDSATATPLTGTSRAGTPKPGEGKKKEKELRKGMPTFRKPQMDDDIIAAMDFGVEIEI